MLRRVVWVSGVALSLTACGPMPGYGPTSEPASTTTRSSPGVEYEDREDGAEAPRYRPPTGPARSVPAPTAPPATPVDEVPVEESLPAAGVPGAAGPTESSRVEVVELGRADTYYLIDRDRRMCFFIHKETSARVDCASIPEGRDVKPLEGDEPPPPVAPAPVRPVAAPPAPAPAPAPPAASPAPSPSAPDQSPTADELARFEAAYIEITCDRRQESFVPPRQRVEAQGLTLERYSAIEGWATGDERGWRMLVNRAYRECASR